MNGPALLTLQRLDSELEQLAGRRRRLPEHEVLAEATRAHRIWIDQVNALRRTIDDAYATIAKTEEEGAVLDTKQARLDAQLKTVIAPREAEALMSQIAGLRARHDELDDIELEAMERQAEAEAALAALQVDEDRLTADMERAAEVLESVLAVLSIEEQGLVERRAQAASECTETELQQYETMRKRHDGVAITTLDGSRCTACHLDLSPAELDIIRHSTGPDLPDCPQCGRLVVL